MNTDYLKEAKLAGIAQELSGKSISGAILSSAPLVSPSPPRSAAQIATTASHLVAGDRDRQHGSKVANHQNIADLWNGYLHSRGVPALSALDVALMMALLKVARTKSGAHNLDDYIDGAGYMACAGEIAELGAREEKE